MLADLARVFSPKAAKVTLERLAKSGADEDGPGKKGKKSKRHLSPAEVTEKMTMEITTDDFAPGLAFVAEVIQQDVPDSLKSGTATRTATCSAGRA